LQNIDDQFRYVLDMGLNTVRLEGKLETAEFFDMADRYGVLIMAGWCCCDHWEHWPKWKPQDFDVAKAGCQPPLFCFHTSLMVPALPMLSTEAKLARLPALRAENTLPTLTNGYGVGAPIS
jgi:hypothetical protein